MIFFTLPLTSVKIPAGLQESGTVFTAFVQRSPASVGAKKSFALMLFSICCELSSARDGLPYPFPVCVKKQRFSLGYSGDSVPRSEELGSLALNEPYSLSSSTYLQSTELLFFCTGKSDP